MECSTRHLKLILRIFEILFTAATLALSFAGRWDAAGGGYVDFCGIACFLFILVWLILYMVNVIPKTFVFFIIELTIYCFMAVMLLIGGIVAAVIAGQFAPYVFLFPWFYRQQRDIIAACSFFAFASAILCGIDIALQVQEYKEGNFQRGTSYPANTTTDSTSTNRDVEMGKNNEAQY